MSTPPLSRPSAIHDDMPLLDAGQSATSWGAVVAGALGAAALSLILLVLGTGLGFAAMSPWSPVQPAEDSKLGAAAIAWLAFTQIAASAVGGYLAGRLRIKWSRLANDEVYFRDTAHGFLAWCLATLLTAALLSSAIGSVASGGAAHNAVSAVAARSALPPEAPAAGASAPIADPPSDAGVRGAVAEERERTDAMRKAAAYSALWMFVAMLAGAFVASWAATFGGRHRDSLTR